ncbi:MAG: glycosyl hydrolase [Verrucomicrobiota bacterium]
MLTANKHLLRSLLAIHWTITAACWGQITIDYTTSDSPTGLTSVDVVHDVQNDTATISGISGLGISGSFGNVETTGSFTMRITAIGEEGTKATVNAWDWKFAPGAGSELAKNGDGWGVTSSKKTDVLIDNKDALLFEFDFSGLSLGRGESLELVSVTVQDTSGRLEVWRKSRASSIVPSLPDLGEMLSPKASNGSKSVIKPLNIEIKDQDRLAILNDLTYAAGKRSFKAITFRISGPRDFEAEAGNGQVNLNWANELNNKLKSYNLYRSTTSPVNMSNNHFYQNIQGNTYIDANVSNGTNYFYAISPKFKNGKEGVLSAEIHAMPTEPAPLLIDKKATQETVELYKNVQQLAKTRIMYGVQRPFMRGYHAQDLTYYANSDIREITGSNPSVIGLDLRDSEDWYLWINSDYDIPSFDWKNPEEFKPPKFEDARYHETHYHEIITRVHRRGGIISLSWHMPNPTNDLDFDSRTGDPVTNTLIEGSAANIRYKYYLDEAAGFFKAMKDDEGKLIPIFFRPLHEQNHNSFWWSGKNATKDEHIALWKLTVEYLRDVKGVHNLIYIQSPNNARSFQEFLEKYPGPGWVDGYGVDMYNKRNFESDLRLATQIIVAYAREYNKIAALTEVGVKGGFVQYEDDDINFENGYIDPKNFDWYSRHLLPLKNNPTTNELAWILQWSSWLDTSKSDLIRSWTPVLAKYRPEFAVSDEAVISNFIDFRNDEWTLFEHDVPDLYTLTGTSTVQPFQHLDANDAASVKSDVDEFWIDLSGNENHAVLLSGEISYPSVTRSKADLIGIDVGTSSNRVELFSASESDDWLDQTVAGADGFCAILAVANNDLASGKRYDLFGNNTKQSSNSILLRTMSNGKLQASLGKTVITADRYDDISDGDTVVFAINYDPQTQLFEFWDSINNIIHQKTVSAQDFSNSNPVTIGRTTHTNRSFNGAICEVKIFDQFLSASHFRFETRSMVTKWIVEGIDYWWPELGMNIGPEYADFDGDGLNNLTEYALGGNPLNFRIAPRGFKLYTDQASGDMQFSHMLLRNDLTIGYQVQSSSDLQTWKNVDWDFSEFTVDEKLDERLYQVPEPDEQLFIRILIEK